MDVKKKWLFDIVSGFEENPVQRILFAAIPACMDGIQNTGYRIRDTEYGIQDTGYRIQKTRQIHLNRG
jgi:hypothetical protein